MRDKATTPDEHAEKRRNLLIYISFLLVALVGYLLISVQVSRAGSCRALDYDKISFEQDKYGRWAVNVIGQTPYINMRVKLLPRTYVTRPKYWGIEVVGCYPGIIGLPAIGRFNVSLALNHAKGIKGVEIIGKSKSFKRAL